jgi:hypothetical protein
MQYINAPNIILGIMDPLDPDTFLISCSFPYSEISFFISLGLHPQYHNILESLYLSYIYFEIPDIAKTVYLQR